MYVEQGGTGRTVLTTYGVMLGEGSNNVNVTDAGTDGQVLLGSSTGDPAFGTISSPLGSLTLTPGHNSLAVDLTVPVAVQFGGTGQTILTMYGVVLGEGTNSVNVTAAGTNGQVLIGSSTGDPAFSTITSVGGTITFSYGPNSLNLEVTSDVEFVYVEQGGTGRTVLTTYGVMLGEGSNNVNVTAAGTDGQVLIGSSTGDPAFGTITSPLGTLTFGVGHNSLTADLVVPVIVGFGGTGRTTLTTYGVVLGEGANNVNVTAAGTDGQVLIGGTSIDPAFTTLASSSGSIQFSPGPNSLSIDVVGGGLPWIYTTTSTYFTNNTGIIANSSTPTVAVLTLPETAPRGSVIRVSGMGTGGWQIATSPTTAGQVINFGDVVSSSSTPLASTEIGDAVELLCVTANQTWFVLSAQGNLTVT